MKNTNDLNELETVDKLNELMEHIERNQWEHLYLNLEIVDNLSDKINSLKEDKKEMHGVFKNLLKIINNYKCQPSE